MKTKWFRRLLSSVLVVMLLFCSLPLNAFAVESPVQVTSAYKKEDDGVGQGTSFADSNEEQELKNAISLPDNTANAGENFTPKLPEKLTYDGTTATFNLVRVYVGWLISTDTAPTAPVFGGGKSLDVSDGEISESVTLPPNSVYVSVYYIWERTAKEPEQPGGRPEIVTNVINSLTRTVNQGEEKRDYKTQYGMDIYKVESKNDLTLTYSADMDMTKLGSSFFGDSSWETLQKHWTEIKDATWVDLHFQFDEKVTITDDAPANANLESDMFSEKYNEDDPGKWWTITEDNELILHCQWDSAKAKENMETKGKLDPMIKLTGVKVALPADWGDKDTIVIRNHGYVNGQVCARLEGATNDEWVDIDGGEKDDEFVLTTSDKVSLPGLDKSIIVDGKEVDNTSVNVGDPIEFQLKSNVPEDLKELIVYTGTGEHDDVDVVGKIPDDKTYTLTFHDKMNSNFTVPTIFDVRIGNPDTSEDPWAGMLTQGVDFTVITNPEDCTFEIQLDLAALYNKGIIKDEDLGKTSITVSYNTKLKDTVTNGTFENESWVTAGEWETSHDTVTVDTYQIDIHKFGNGQINTEPLAGAHFKLYQKVDGKEVIVEGCDDLISGKDGHVKVNGLKAGTYYLKETQAPDGYVCSDKEVEIKIPERANEENVVKVNFDNRSIPHTGGMGTTIFSIVGGVLIAMAGTVFVISRRKRRA